MGAILTNITEIFANSGWAQIFLVQDGWKYAVMLAVACVLLYLAIVKQFDQPAAGRHLPYRDLPQ